MKRTEDREWETFQAVALFKILLSWDRIKEQERGNAKEPEEEQREEQDKAQKEKKEEEQKKKEEEQEKKQEKGQEKEKNEEQEGGAKEDQGMKLGMEHEDEEVGGQQNTNSETDIDLGMEFRHEDGSLWKTAVVRRSTDQSAQVSFSIFNSIRSRRKRSIILITRGK